MKRVIFSMILVAAFVGCTKRIDAPSTVDNALRMNASQSDFVSDDTTSADTRATETAFQSGDAIGVYLHTTTTVGSSGNHSSNMKYLTTNAGGTWQAASSLSEALDVATPYKATGYYPHKVGVVNPLAVPHQILANQSTAVGDEATALENSDFMIAKATAITVKSPQLAEVTLNFTHLLTKLVVSVGVPSTIENIKVTGVKSVTISGLNSKCNVNLATLAVTPVAQSVVAVTPRLVSGGGTPGNISAWEAIVVPQSVAASTEMVKFVCDMEDGSTRDLTYTVPAVAPLALNSGKKLTLTLSSSADLAFTSSIDLVNGEPKTNIPLTIKAPSGTGWTLTSGGNWLTVASTEGGAYASQITGTGTGVNQTVYVKVDANNTAAAGYIPRSATLTLSDNKGAAITYRVVQNYTRFDPVFSAWNITAAAGQSKAIESFATNQLWTATPTDVTAGLGLKLATSATIGNEVLTAPHDGIGTLAANTLFMQIADANNTNNALTGKVVVEIKDGNPRRFVEISVAQAAPAIANFTNTLAAYSGTAASWSSGNKSVTPASGLRWSITGDAGLTVAPTGAQSAASTAVSVSVGANNTASPRTFNFQLNYGALDGTLKTNYTVIQAAPVLAVSSGAQDVASTATSATFNVTAAASHNGVTYTPAAGINATSVSPAGLQTIAVSTVYSQTITVNFAANTASTEREIVATITYAGSKKLTHTITQASAGPPTVTIAGTKWTTANLTGDASTNAGNIKVCANPQDYGMFFKWASTFVYGRISSASEGGGFANSDYTRGSSTVPTTQSKGYDYVGLNGLYPGDPCQKLGSSYKTPTSAQIKALFDAGSSGWKSYKGVAGWFFGPGATGANDSTIPAGCLFFPAAGCRAYNTGVLTNQGSGGDYWSSSVYHATYGWHLSFYSSGGIYPENDNPRSFGFSVRCVQE